MIEKKYFVSVIVPNYCHALYLRQRLNSILNQTYQDFELIVLDDCSPDAGASKKVIEHYRNDSHVSHIVYNELNSGSTFKQWERGIKLAKGELIWIAESDDFCETILLEALVGEFKKNENLVLAYSLLQTVDSNGVPIKLLRYTPHGVTRLNGSDFVRKYMTTSNHCANASAALFKKKAFFDISDAYTTYKAGGDMRFWVEIAKQGDVAIVNKRLNYFRQHEQKVTLKSTALGINLIEYKKTYDYILENFKIETWRQDLMKDYVYYQIFSLPTISNEAFNNLIVIWKAPHSMPIPRYFRIKFWHILHRRFSIYL